MCSKALQAISTKGTLSTEETCEVEWSCYFKVIDWENNQSSFAKKFLF